MKLIELSAIKVAENRQRKVFNQDRLHELKDSIERLGLQNPIVLRTVGDTYQLVSGERRLRVIQDIYDLGGVFRHDGSEVRVGCIPYTTLSDLGDLAAEEAELEENTKRADLTFQELAAATKRLFALRKKQAEASGVVAPTVADLSLEIRDSKEGVNHERTRRELIIAEHLDTPEVQNAKTLDEAFKNLQVRERKGKDAALAERVGKVYTADVHRVLNEDSLAWLPKCPSESFDVILTDPPYGMGAHEFGDSGGKAEGAHSYVDDASTFQRILDVCPTQFFRVAKPQAHLYWFCDIDWFFQLRQDLEMAGWQVFRTPFIWYKRHGARAPLPEHGPQRKYETILYAIKGKRPVRKMAGDVLDFPADDNLGNSAQKPVALYEELLKRSALPGDSVLDPFAGTGTIFAAADLMKCRATGIEMDPVSYGIAVKRLTAMKEAA